VTRLHLVGGGWAADASARVYGPFLADATAAAAGRPTIACVVLDEGDGAQRFEQWAQVLTSIADCAPRPVIVPLGEVLDPARLQDADALLVGGGLTPGYADALVPVAVDIRAWLTDGDRPYAGFSAGAAIAARWAVVGGWRSGGVPVCPEDTGEDLDELTVVPGLGLTKWTVDVHCAQWGTLPRLIEIIRASAPGQGRGNGLAIDENTMVTIDADGRLSVAGTGHAWLVHRGGGHREAKVTPLPAGTRPG
jgi:cyanophycinase